MSWSSLALTLAKRILACCNSTLICIRVPFDMRRKGLTAIDGQGDKDLA
jgi:hypothetical protein